MNANEIREKIQEIDRMLYALSDELVKPIEWDGLDPVYLKSKFQSVVNTVKHVDSQFKHLKSRGR